MVPSYGAQTQMNHYQGVDQSDASSKSKANASWLDVSWLMLSDVVGTSVLSFSGVAATLGWVWTMILIVGMCPMAIYSAVIMSRTHCLVPRSHSMGEAAKHIFGDKYETPVLVAVYGFAALGQGSYILVLGKAFQGVAYDRALCLPLAVLIGCAVCSPFVMSMRRLVDSVLLCFLNTLLIVVVIVVVAQQLITDGRGSDIITDTVAPNVDFFTVFGGLTNILYAYTGHWMYFELMSEMSHPEHFPRVFRINGPFCVLCYLAVAIVGYYYEGRAAHSNFLDALARGALYRAASAILFAHIVVVYVLKSIVLSRFLHSRTSRHFDTDSWRGRVEYALWSLALLGLAFLVSQAVPFFSQLLGLLGGLLAAPVSFLLPAALYFAAVTSSESFPGRPLAFRLHYFRTELPWWDLVSFVLMVTVALGTMVMGTSDVIAQLANKTATEGAPFDCHLLDESN